MQKLRKSHVKVAKVAKITRKDKKALFLRNCSGRGRATEKKKLQKGLAH